MQWDGAPLAEVASLLLQWFAGLALPVVAGTLGDEMCDSSVESQLIVDLSSLDTQCWSRSNTMSSVFLQHLEDKVSSEL